MAESLDARAGEPARGALRCGGLGGRGGGVSSEELSASSAQISASAEETSAQSGVVSGRRRRRSRRNVQTVAAGAEQMGASIREIASNAAEA